MALVFIVETGAGLVDATAYCDVAWGDDFHASHLYASVWTDMTTSEKQSALVWATRLLDEQVEWAGWKTTQEQALRWPRSGAPDRESSASLSMAYYDYGVTLASNIIPVWLKNATAELARTLKASDRTADLSTVGYSEITVDKLNVLPDSVLAMVLPYGRVQRSGGITFARLVRA